MKEYALPEDAQQRLRLGKRIARLRAAYGGMAFALALAAIGCLVGLVVAVLMLEFGERTPERERLLYILTGAFAGGTIVLSLAAFALAKASQTQHKRELDYRERCCGARCFFVGEGTIAEFCADSLKIYAEGEAFGENIIVIPYADVRFHSVCTRRKPCEAGEWSVVLEIPWKYVAKKGKREEGAPPAAFIQTDAKERLYRCMDELGLGLLGEAPPRGSRPARKKYIFRAKFILPDTEARRRTIWMIAFGAILLIAGIVIALLFNVTLGTLAAVFGAFLAARSVYSFIKAKGILAFYDEGVYWKEGGRAVSERIFLTWGEICGVKRETLRDRGVLTISCAYGNYHLPDVAGAYEYIGAMHPELCAGSEPA